MGRTQDLIAYEYNTKLLHSKHQALDLLNGLFQKALDKGADSKVIAQLRMAATAILRTKSETVGYDLTTERRKAEALPTTTPQAATATPAPAITPTSIEVITSTAPLPTPTHVPLADEANGKLPKWMRRELKRAGLASLPNLSLESG